MKKVAAVAVALAATAALAACEKPPPGVTVFTGTSSQRIAPICFSWEGQINAEECLTQAATAAADGQTKTLDVVAENVVGISVDPSIAEAGWYPTIAGQRLSQESLTTTYFRFTFPRVPANPQGYPLAVVSEGEEKGVWTVRMDVQS
ncbi:MAG: hypothetical protein MUF33_00720 [Candidatus Nanopelagicales bacterium]|jgi:hypothetical protein|nr:hypothetical protein [Candidatus Nanopelagicales bacterium]